MLVQPSLAHLAPYRDALERGWAPDNIAGEVSRRDQLARSAADPAAFIASQDDPDAKAGPIPLPGGRLAPRLPGIQRWLWDGEFCGRVGLRWQNGTAALPAHVPGHVGFAVVPWKRGRGYAKAALAQILPEARARGLPHIDLTTDPENIVSQRVILANGGCLVERFCEDAALGGGESLRFRILL